jgi:hypothetical protein
VYSLFIEAVLPQILTSTFSLLQVRAVTHAPICYIVKPVHNDMVCSEHPRGCGKSLVPGERVMVNAGQCRYYLCTQFVSVRRLNGKGECTCKVGYVKVLPDMVRLVGNRLGVVDSVHRRTGDEISVTTLDKSEHLTSNVTKLVKPKPKAKSDDEGTSARAKPTGKTLELCDCVHDYAMMTFLDGGVPSFASRAFENADDDDDDDDDDGNNDDNDGGDLQDTDDDDDGEDSDDSGDYDSDGNPKKMKAKTVKKKDDKLKKKRKRSQ